MSYCNKDFKVNFGLLLYLIFFFFAIRKGNEKFILHLVAPLPLYRCLASFQNTLLITLRGKGKNAWEVFASGIDVIYCIYFAASFK